MCAVRDGGCKYCKKYCEKAYCTVILHTSVGVARIIKQLSVNISIKMYK